MSRRNIISFATGFVLLVVVIFMDRMTFVEMRSYSEAVDHTREVITSLEKLANLFKSAQVYSPSYEKISNHSFYNLYKSQAQEVVPQLAKIRSLVRDSPAQWKRVDSLSNAVTGQLPALMKKNIVELILSGEMWRLQQLYDIDGLINRTINAEVDLLNIRKAKLQKSADTSATLTVLFSIIAVSLIIVTFFYNVILLRRRKWLESFLGSVLNTSQNGIITYKAVRQHGKITDFKILFANAAVERLLGLSPELVTGRRVSEIPTSFVSQTHVFTRYVSVVETAQQTQFETLYEANGKKGWFNVLVAKLEDGITASFHDITQLKTYQEELQNNIKWLARSNEELEQYAYIASHDLQEPLRKIMVYADLLHTSGKMMDERSKAHLDKVSGAAQRMSSLIADILNFSGTSKMPAFTATNLEEIWHNVVEDQEIKINQLDVQIVKDELPVIDAIPLQMNQLFYNLLSNSLKFVRENVKPVITITSAVLTADEQQKFESLQADKKYIKIIFSDNGIGFPQEYAEHIFGLFKRLNERQTYPGSGIGLSLCRKVVYNHNGLMMAEGSDGGGASFTIILPQTQEL